MIPNWNKRQRERDYYSRFFDYGFEPNHRPATTHSKGQKLTVLNTISMTSMILGFGFLMGAFLTAATWSLALAVGLVILGLTTFILDRMNQNSAPTTPC